MRNPDRIKPTLELINEVWKRYPDMRLGQLIENMAARTGKSIWNMEEEELQVALNGWLKQLKENE